MDAQGTPSAPARSHKRKSTSVSGNANVNGAAGSVDKKSENTTLVTTSSSSASPAPKRQKTPAKSPPAAAAPKTPVNKTSKQISSAAKKKRLATLEQEVLTHVHKQTYGNYRGNAVYRWPMRPGL